MNKPTAIVVGAGIAGLASAHALALKGYIVTVIEKTEKAIGASIRNFGMIWPIGQPDGILYNRAIRSKLIWKDIADKANLWYDECGSLHVAHYDDEWQVLQELYASFKAAGRNVQLMNRELIAKEFNGIKVKGLKGGLYSDAEIIVNAPTAISAISNYFNEQLDIKFIFNKTVTAIETGKLYCNNEIFKADVIIICAGAEFECLYPSVFKQVGITKCKLQMMRFASPLPKWFIGTAVCGGLSLIHYNSFKIASSLPALQQRFEQELPEYIKNGIHVMVAQNNAGELTVGDSHEYGNTLSPFNSEHINNLIIKYLEKFIVCNNWQMIQSWNGTYAKMIDGTAGLFLNPQQGVYILNGMGGAGMTLSFGFAEEMITTI